MLPQEINLYRCLKKSSSDAVFFTWQRLWIANAIVCSILFVAYISMLGQVYYLSAKKSDLQKQVTLLQSKFLQIKSRYLPSFFSQNPDMLHQDILLQQKILETITNRIPFSQDLMALAKNVAADVWLTQIAILNGGQVITLKGQSLGSSQLQTYLQNIMHEKTFSDLEPNIGDIENAGKKDDNGNLTFEISIGKKG